MIKPIAVYDGHTRKRLAFLQNAYNISYEKNANTLWTAEFSLPYSDPKTKHCQAFNLVELWDGNGGERGEYVGLFRIMPRTEETLGTEANIVYSLEHVLGTLFDDTLIDYHEIGNLGVYTNQVIGYILEKQTETRWVLGDCDYAHQFLYGWQDENLLSALFSVVHPFEETDYIWDFETESFPWTLHLRKVSMTPVTDIRYKKNLNGLTRIVDPTNLTTRLYCYGYGQGDNKLNIKEFTGGLAYLESDNVAKYGVITQVWNDERFTIAESLYNVGKAMLAKLEEPAVSYEIDIQMVRGAASLQVGDAVRFVSSDIDEVMIVKHVSKDDVTGQPFSGTILLGAGTIDISDSMADLADRQRIAETYSQGAESIFTDSFVDNADEENPAEVVFVIPENAVHVNEIRFSCQLTNFRAYSRAVEGGGQEGLTTEFNPVAVVTTESVQPSIQTTESGNTSTKTTLSETSTIQSSMTITGNTQPTSGQKGGFSRDLGITNNLPNSPSNTHNHGLGWYTPLMYGPLSVTKNAAGQVTDVWANTLQWVPSGDHTHNISVTDHTHSVDISNHSHNISLYGHSHNLSLNPHSHMIDSQKLKHSHRIEGSDLQHKHAWTLPNHTHQINYGIYKGPRASAMSIYLDETLVGEYETYVNDINLIDYMSKSANGNVMRGKHTIRIVPNALTRVECTFQIRLFTNMHGDRQF